MKNHVRRVCIVYKPAKTLEYLGGKIMNNKIHKNHAKLVVRYTSRTGGRVVHFYF